ncbi:Nuclear RNA export factor 1 [Papilio xuthus]|uniref:Nuclear RNA export factor 1 n=1 Tax=Papilio xuthus TaxID=66420 RepID=A0A194PC93_PAPXU|nr:Nuclear RNA export factor 1 [Papilio xuthus]
MPKRGGGRIKNWKTDNDHFEHDDRTHNPRRVSFKPGTNKGKNKFNNWNKNAKLLLDDDVDMGLSGGQGPRKPFRGRGGRLGSPAPRPRHAGKKFTPGMLPWYQIVIPYGAKHEKDVILRALLNFTSPDIFIPHYYRINGNAAIFYVDDVKSAENLFNADKKIVMPDGFKMVVIVKNAVPNVNVDANMKEKMKLVMAKRYNPATKALDMTKFHSDSDLSEIFCGLFRPVIMLTAIDIIAENIPDIEALNLNDNKLHGLDHLKVMATKLKNLKILYLGDNRIPVVGSLESLRNLPLVELMLKGNPLRNRFNDHDDYVSTVRKKFPKLVRLDGVDLPPAIGFDVAEDVALPAQQQSFLIEPAAQDFVRQFLAQYFAVYDSESRQSLMDAYHENATMSMTTSYLTHDIRNSPSTKLHQYLPNSRNILRITDRESRRRYLRTGKLQVVAFICDLPKTTHDLMGFAVDVLIYTPTMIMVSMNGVFKETASQGSRSFHRTFMIVPNNGGGFCIVNDMLFITNTTKEQEEKMFQSGVPAAAPTPVAATTSAPAPAPAPAPAASEALHSEHHRMLLNALGQQTGMNDYWSMNCLQETGWDLQKAMFIFNKLQSEGKIPHEAFVK